MWTSNGSSLSQSAKVALLSPSLLSEQHGSQELSRLRPTGAPAGLDLDRSEYRAINKAKAKGDDTVRIGNSDPAGSCPEHFEGFSNTETTPLH